MLRGTGHNVMSWALILVTLSWMTPRTALSQGATTPAAVPAPLAVKLTTDGRLVGQVLTPGGSPAAGAMIAIGREGKLLSKAETNDEGRFAFKNVKPGRYELATQHAGAFVECFAPQTAPASASNGILMSREEIVRRGQQPIENLLHPLLVGLVIAVAIALPIAIHNSDDDDAS